MPYYIEYTVETGLGRPRQHEEFATLESMNDRLIKVMAAGHGDIVFGKEGGLSVVMTQPMIEQ